MPVRTLRWLLLLLLALAGTARGVLAQAPTPLKVTDLGKPLVDLGGPWQFRYGDDMRWASPAFDDARWKTITTDKGWDLQGYPDTAGFGWYRRQVTLLSPPVAGQPLAFRPMPVNGAYQIFWNGVLIGGCGTMPPHLRIRVCWQATTLPAALQQRDNLVAIRVANIYTRYLTPPGQQGLVATPQLGMRDAVEAADRQGFLEQLQTTWLHSFIGLLYALLALVTLLVWLQARAARLYLWLTGLLAVCATRPAIDSLYYFNRLAFQWEVAWVLIFGYAGLFAALCLVLLWLFRLEESRAWLRLTLWLSAVVMLLALAQATLCFFMMSWGLTAAAAYITLGAVQMILSLYPLALVFAGLRRHTSPARWCVAVSATLSLLVFVTGNSAQLLQQWQVAGWISSSHPLLHLWGSEVSIETLNDFFLLLSLGYAAVESQLENRRQRTERELELRSAAEVQQVLLPDETPVIPGFRIESVYRPAGQVGGDFFQVLPLDDSGVLVAIGDVSGKGMPAAMTVALLVGVLRATAEYTRSPAALLAAMNRRLLGRGSGFTTCLVLHVQPGGAATLANAGHLQPYLDGEELTTEPGLPLGLAEGVSYDELAFVLAPTSQLTLLTDGVVEARNQQGQLLGFEQTRRLAAESAESIAGAGAAFGQIDDITVLTVRTA